MRTGLVVATCVAALAGCSFTPPLAVPVTPVPADFKEAAPWIVAAPADRLPRDAWWTLYGDPDLDALQKQLVDGSPDLAAALARYQQAQALTAQYRSFLFPTLTGQGNAQADRQSTRRPLRVLGPSSPDDYNQYTLGVQLDYEFDLWGRVRAQLAAGRASEEAAGGDLESARLSLQAQLADNYISLRGLDRDVALLRDAVNNFQRAVELTTSRHEGGIASGLDVARAQTQLDATRAAVSQSLAQRALIEHAIAALVGAQPSSFTIAPRIADLALPSIPTGLPSTLLQRRPDIAAAERRIEAANFSIGVAQAARFPQVTLSGLIGYQSDNFGNFVGAPNAFWAVGPTLAAPLFDAGRRRAEVERTRAVLDEASARYRSTVLGAFQQVEDNLALLNHYRDAAASEKSALVAAQRSLDYATLRYREGAVNYLEVVTAQTATLDTQRTSLNLDTLQRRASVQLIRALGGGWVDPSSPLARGDATAPASGPALATY